MSRKNESELQISSSVMNFVDSSTPKKMTTTALWTIGRFHLIAQQAGYADLEWHPLRLLAGWQLRTGLVNPQQKAIIGSLHQSWRSEKSPTEAWRHPNRKLALASYIIFPERIRSLSEIERIQQIVGKRLLAVLYPPLPGEESGTQRSFKETVFQPTPDVMASFGVKTVEELVEVTAQRGYSGFCPDLFHMRKPGPINLNPWQSNFPLLLRHSLEIHVSAGRNDMRSTYIDTNAELKDLLEGTEKTDLPRMLRTVRDEGFRGRIVTETPTDAIALVLGIPFGILTKTRLVDAHRHITDHTRHFLS